MKIDSILLRELNMSLVKPFTTSFGQTLERRVLLVEIRAEGLSGWGECTTGEHPYSAKKQLTRLGPSSSRSWRRRWHRAAWPMGESAPRSFAGFVETAWPKQPWKMRCGI